MFFAWVHVPVRVFTTTGKPWVPIQVRAVDKLFWLSITFVVPTVFISVMPVALYSFVSTLYVVYVCVATPLSRVPTGAISIVMMS
jgi:hypothetical protein